MKIRLETLEIGVEGENLDASLLAPSPAVPGVLFVHGWGGSQAQDLQRARDAAGLGCICMTFDLRGHSRTKAQAQSVSREKNLADLTAVYDQFAAHPGVEASSIAVVGSSYGAYLAAVLTSLRPVRWLALRAPALYKDEGWQTPKVDLNKDPDLAAYRRRRLEPEMNRALKACASFRGDVLIVESEFDDLTPHASVMNHISALTHARSITFRTITGADHALSREVDQRAYTQILMAWLTEMVIGARGDAIPPEVPHADKKPESSAPQKAANRQQVVDQQPQTAAPHDQPHQTGR